MYIDEEWYLCNTTCVYKDNPDRQFVLEQVLETQKYKVNEQWLFEEVTNNQ